ncbi:MAG: bifunctional tetrahydrofolate synthase/dihydrofolate synthase [Gammaproteobacteria bacterium]|nr:MAG: bifunctional tetrahydrofolate synthase/dihydrofolate synthase [Gammaproteobacteria bacterium]
MGRSLEAWLDWQARLHPKEIDLGLERAGAVARRLGVLEPSMPVITVAGTNGKGSSVALIESVARAHGLRTFAYTSPHLRRYNERMRIDGAEAEDAALCAAFEAVERAREGTSLSYFEFGTLAALWLFRTVAPDLAILEVGLGGRLDAVNIVDPTVALITPVALDHADWLGTDRELIGREKAGIMRAGRPVVCSDPNPPASIAETARELGAGLHRIGQDFGVREEGEHWWLEAGAGKALGPLPEPGLSGEFQRSNAAGALRALQLAGFELEQSAVARGLDKVRLPGRLQRMGQEPEWLLDVAHNPHATRALAEWLSRHPMRGRQVAVIGVMADKAVGDMLSPLRDIFAQWLCVQPDVERALSASALAEALRQAGVSGDIEVAGSVAEGLRRAGGMSAAGDRIVVFGSFYTVGEALDYNDASPDQVP